MNIKEQILDEIVPDWASNIARTDVYEAMDLYARKTVSLFGEFMLSNRIQYDNGKNPDWGKLSHSQMEDKFFSELPTYR